MPVYVSCTLSPVFFCSHYSIFTAFTFHGFLDILCNGVFKSYARFKAKPSSVSMCPGPNKQGPFPCWVSGTTPPATLQPQHWFWLVWDSLGIWHWVAWFCVAQAVLRLLPQPPECWGSRHAPSCPAGKHFKQNSKLSLTSFFHVRAQFQVLTAWTKRRWYL